MTIICFFAGIIAGGVIAYHRPHWVEWVASWFYKDDGSDGESGV